jgi:hypothetical protein
MDKVNNSDKLIVSQFDGQDKNNATPMTFPEVAFLFG